MKLGNQLYTKVNLNDKLCLLRKNQFCIGNEIWRDRSSIGNRLITILVEIEFCRLFKCRSNVTVSKLKRVWKAERSRLLGQLKPMMNHFMLADDRRHATRRPTLDHLSVAAVSAGHLLLRHLSRSTLRATPWSDLHSRCDLNLHLCIYAMRAYPTCAINILLNHFF